MFSKKQLATISVVSLICITMPSFAIATPQKTIVKDGKVHTVKNLSNQNSSNVVCDNMKANIMAQKLNNSPANVMATIVIHSGSQKNAFRVFDIAKDELTQEHDISSMKVGCLTSKGGVGINIPHHSSVNLGINIQIDTKGHVFLGYDEAGLKLVTSQK